MIAAQALSLCGTDQIVDEVSARTYSSGKPPETGLKDFKTNLLLTELAYRAQKIAMTLVEAQNMLVMSELLFSGDGLFPTTFQDLNGYSLTGSKDD